MNPWMVTNLEIYFTPLIPLQWTHGQRLLENNIMDIVNIQIMQTLANVP
jgi:hypothetical protein